MDKPKPEICQNCVYLFGTYGRCTIQQAYANSVGIPSNSAYKFSCKKFKMKEEK